MDNLDFAHLDADQGNYVRQMVRIYDDMSDGALGKINSVKHHISLTPNQRPFMSHQYRVGPVARKEIDKEKRDMT